MKLSGNEQRNVRAALRFLCHRAGGWGPIATALERSTTTITMVVGGRRTVTVELAYGVARAAGTTLDVLLAGGLKICPHCGRNADEEEFEDEGTVTEDEPREAVLKLINSAPALTVVKEA